MRTPLFVCLPASLALLLGACSGVSETPGTETGATTDAAGIGGLGGTAGATTTGGMGGDGGPSCDGPCTTPRCGDGRIDQAAGEVCDDGNDRSGDGCSGLCNAIEKDYACPQPAKLCTYLIKCGDALLGGNERCDPPNVGKGCSADCRIESGYLCAPPPTPPEPRVPASCRKTLCGDTVKEGAEACDDGNLIDGDGCSAGCTLEPDCGAGTCSSKCGDRMKLPPESCDDGNTEEGDGCSHDCKLETGFTCSDTTANPPAQLNLAVTYRDFISFPLGTAVRHPDFEIFAGMFVTPSLIAPMLDADGKPVMDGRCAAAGVTANCPHDQQLTGTASFNQWYRDTSGINIAVKGTLLLPRQANGSYIYDSGNRGFYPIDNKGWTAAPAKEDVATADPTVNDGRDHNFGFTTEIRYFFQYNGGESLTFSGDDDVWIFFNRTLALDLGGLHPRTQRTLNVDQSAAALGLTVGGLYEIVLFQAERHSTGSNFQLTLTGFAPASSACQSACGDKVVASTEQCDDGNNVDGDGCSHDCHVEITLN